MADSQDKVSDSRSQVKQGATLYSTTDSNSPESDSRLTSVDPESKIVIPRRLVAAGADCDDSDDYSDEYTTSSSQPASDDSDRSPSSASSEEERTVSASAGEHKDLSKTTSAIQSNTANTDHEIIKSTMEDLNKKHCNMSKKSLAGGTNTAAHGTSIGRDQYRPEPTGTLPTGTRLCTVDLGTAVGVLNKTKDTGDTKANASTVNSTTNVEDTDGRYFTIINDLPRKGPCKKCPKMPLFDDFKDWWKLQQNLVPRCRHSLRIGLIVLGSVLLLLAIFLLARLPTSVDDVSQPSMYDLPSDDAFRPKELSLLMDPDLPPLPQEDHSDVVGGQPFPHDGSVEGSPVQQKPGRRPGFPPRHGSSADEIALQMDIQRRNRLAFRRPAPDMQSMLKVVRQTVDTEREQMKTQEKAIWDSNATPLKILLVSTWRSGSTFLGQVLQQHPGVFQHYEPFSYLGVRQVRSGNDAFQSQQVLHRLLDCRFSGVEEYLNYTKINPVDMTGHNKRIWKACNAARNIDMCSNATFLTEACKMFPIQLVKTVRLRLNLTQLFLGETRLNAKVVFLVRDPRATISSRRSSVKWCDKSQDCSSPQVLCSDLKADLKVSAALEKLYPNSFIMVRYEDLANEPNAVIERLLNFLGMEYTDDLAKFVAEHTKSDGRYPWSIARKSAARISRWKDILATDEVEEIQKVCKPVIEKLGYDLVDAK